MSEKTKIEWANSTASPWTGCTEASPGCANCYARAMAKRYGWCEWGNGKPRHRFEGFHANVMRMNRKPLVCDTCGHVQKMHDFRCLQCDTRYPRRRRLFPSACDWLDDEMPIEWLAESLVTMHQADQLIKLLLTKRPENWMRLMEAASKAPMRESTYQWLQLWILGQAPENFWIGTSIENQDQDYRIKHLLQTPAKVRFLSLEPLLGPIDISSGTYASDGKGVVWDAFGNVAHTPYCDYTAKGPGIDWVIVGGESGPKARPCDVEWIRDIVRQCKAAGVPCFVKQLGAHPFSNGTPNVWPIKTRFGDTKNGETRPILKHPKGGDMSEWPENLRVREFPKV